MQKFFYYCIIVCLSFFSIQCSAPSQQESSTKSILKVGVFEGYGGAQTCIWESVASILLDEDMEVSTFTTADIAAGVLDTLDAIIIPGGSGSKQYLNMGAENRKRIVDFVANGGGAVGICAGAYFFSDTPGYACIGINGLQAIDIEHDNRGHGIAKFTLTQAGKKILPEIADRDTSYIMYYEGPVFVAGPTSDIKAETLAIMESDVHEEGNAPANMTNGKPLISINEYGKGRVCSIIAHPEGTPGMAWIIPRMIRWTLNQPIKSYSEAVVQPSLFEKEILMTQQRLEEEAIQYKQLLHGSPQEKIVALEWLHAHLSWDAKRWIQGLLFDEDPQIRCQAAAYIATTQYLPYLKDLKVATAQEKDPIFQEELQIHHDKLLQLLPTPKQK